MPSARRSPLPPSPAPAPSRPGAALAPRSPVVVPVPPNSSRAATPTPTPKPPASTAAPKRPHRFPGGRSVSKLSPEEVAIVVRFRQACGRQSFRDLARAAGVSHESIRRYQTGRCMPPLIVVAKLCKHLNVPTEWMLYGELPKPQ